jgi:hypothetical protein
MPKKQQFSLRCTKSGSQAEPARNSPSFPIRSMLFIQEYLLQ